MKIKSVVLILLLSWIAIAGCGDENNDTCKPRDLIFCFDKHQIWTCAPDDASAADPVYTDQLIDCRQLNDGQKPYCGTEFNDDGSRGSTECRTELIGIFGDT